MEQLPAAGETEDSLVTVSLEDYQINIEKSWVWSELYSVRNVRPFAHSRLGMIGMMAYTGLIQYWFKGAEPFTLKHEKPDSECLKPAAECKPIEYPMPDNKVSFDLLSS